MVKTATVVYLVCFCVYILFTRQPDYFYSDFAKGKIVLLEKDRTKKSVEYKVGSETFVVPIKGWGASQVAAGDVVEVIHDADTPSVGSLYTFFAYWLKLPEVLGTAIVYAALFMAAISITGKQEPEEEVPPGTYIKKRKYKD